MRRFRYSAWDGSQSIAFDADDVFGEITDDLLYHGDVNAALRRLLQQGFQFGDERLRGLREMLDRLRRARQERLQQYDLDQMFDGLDERLDEILEQEEQGIERRVQEAAEAAARPGAPPQAQTSREIIEGLAEQRREQLANMPRTAADRIQELMGYEFMDDAARQAFQELVDELRQQMLDRMFQGMSQALSDMDPEQLARTKDMMAELNRMLEQRAAGEGPSDAEFRQFMERYGDFFPGNPQNLDELLEQIGRQMAAMQALMNSLSGQQRTELQGLLRALMSDMDLNFQAQMLAENLRALMPQLPWDARYQFSGDDPLSMAAAMEVLNELSDLDAMENVLRNATQPGALDEVDLDKVRDLLGADTAADLARLRELARMLEEAGLIENREGKLQLTPRGLRRIGQNALRDIFTHLRRDRLGGHHLDLDGRSGEPEHATKQYEFGDPFTLDIRETVMNAVKRAGAGTPVRLTPADFEVRRTEHLTQAATVLMLDLSLSMPMRDNFLPAKKMAMALHSLITTQFPRDALYVVTFSEVAREVRPEHLPEVTWDYVYGTNMQHGLMLARNLLSKHRGGNRSIIMVTDGEPTAHLEPGHAEPFFAYPPVQRTLDMTQLEVLRCTRDGIRINTFMLDANYYLQRFVEQMTRLNGGRAFFCDRDNVGDYVLVDYLDRKSSRRRAAS